MGWLAAVVALVLILALLHWLEFASVVPRRWRRAAPHAPRPAEPRLADEPKEHAMTAKPSPPDPERQTGRPDPIRQNPATRRQAEGRKGAERGEDPAAGTPEHPVAPGEAQAGSLAEQGQARGGPADIAPLRGRKTREGGNP